jgi:hypothetical protein
MTKTLQKSTAVGRREDGRDLVVCDGRDAVGFVRQFADCWVAHDAGGKYLGRFADQRAAMRAIPPFRKTAAPARNAAAGREAASFFNAAATGPRRPNFKWVRQSKPCKSRA